MSNTPTFVRLLISAALLASVGGLSGCGPEEEAPTTHERKEANVPVDLPAKPNLDSVLGVEPTYPDGAYKIIGLILSRNDLFASEVTVRGVIRETSLDCPFLTDPTYEKPKQGERELRTCEALYATIADNMSHPKELVIVNYQPWLHPNLQPGMEIVAKGMYDTHGAGFIRPRDGILVVEEVLNMAVDPEGMFYTDPDEVARVKAEAAAAMMEQ